MKTMEKLSSGLFKKQELPLNQIGQLFGGSTWVSRDTAGSGCDCVNLDSGNPDGSYPSSDVILGGGVINVGSATHHR